MPGSIVVYSDATQGFGHRHERATRAGIARRLAALMGCDFVGDYAPSCRPNGPIYFVPSCTLTRDVAELLGIRTEQDLLGGVVPFPFVATKAITHPLFGPDAQRPPGWSDVFSETISDAVLSGFTVFSPEDARKAAAQLLKRGPVRIKPVCATGGRGQVTVRHIAQMEGALSTMLAAELMEHGLVLEEDLTDVTTLSVGQVRVADLVASYYGTQRLTPDNNGVAVYGGSDLFVIRGDFAALTAVECSVEVRLAVAQARSYDAAVMAHFPGILASRRNYDVAQGRDCDGRWRSGVLEQSWRIGGASSAEIAALEAFRAEPELKAVRAISVEVYGEAVAPPPHATVYFQGTDERDGPLAKYAWVEPHGDPR